MLKISFLLILVIGILYILKKNSNTKSNIYSKLILSVIFFGILFIVITSGKFILPQILQILKIGLPLLTRFIGL